MSRTETKVRVFCRSPDRTSIETRYVDPEKAKAVRAMLKAAGRGAYFGGTVER